MTDIFLSTARLDRSRIGRIAEALKARGLDVWWEDLPLQETFFSSTRKKVFNDARCVVVVWSKNSITSDVVVDEALAARRARALIPVRIDKVPMPPQFRRIRTVDIWDWNGDPNAEQISDIVNQVGRIFRGNNMVPATVGEIISAPEPGKAQPSSGPLARGFRIAAAPFIWLFDLAYSIIMITLRVAILILIMTLIFVALTYLLSGVS